LTLRTTCDTRWLAATKQRSKGKQLKLAHFIQWMLNLPKQLRMRHAIAIADAARDRRDWSAAAEAYEAVVKVLPHHASLWGQLGNVLKEARQFGRSEAAYRECMRLSPGNGDTWLQLGHLFKLQIRRQESEYAYVQALKCDQYCFSALDELLNLGWSIADIVSLMPLMTSFDSPAELHPDDQAQDVLPNVVLDISDFLSFLQHFQRPTGIQRVSLSLIRSWLWTPPSSVNLSYAVLSQNTGDWRAVPKQLLSEVCERAVGASLDDAGTWKRTLLRLFIAIHKGPAVALDSRTTLLNLGSPTGITNYHLHVRNAKVQRGIRYFQFVHDCIPLIMPQHFIDEHVSEFLDAMLQTLHATDGCLANSSSTAKDLVTVAKRLGLDMPAPDVIKLDGLLTPPHSVGMDISQRVDGIIRSGRKYVLFVSTIEPRKNHLLALRAWSSLIRDRDRPQESTPRLICVGQWGWKNQAVRDYLEDHKELASHVLVLSSISDADLTMLYRHCEFAIYPSSYEGWGLPVAEALGHSKLPLVARTSSLPEVGGKFAEYFDLDVQSDFETNLRRLIDDHEYVLTKEREIAREYSPRSWTAIGEQILAAIRTSVPGTSGDPCSPVDLQPGRLYSLGREKRRELGDGSLSGSLFKFGLWQPPNDAGAGVHVTADSELRFSLPKIASQPSLLLKVKVATSAPNSSARLQIDVDDETKWERTLSAGQIKWILLSLPSFAGREIKVSFRIHSSGSSVSVGGDALPQIDVCGFSCLCLDDDTVLAAALRSLLHSHFFETDALQVNRTNQGAAQRDNPV